MSRYEALQQAIARIASGELVFLRQGGKIVPVPGPRDGEEEVLSVRMMVCRSHSGADDDPDRLGISATLDSEEFAYWVVRAPGLRSERWTVVQDSCGSRATRFDPCILHDAQGEVVPYLDTLEQAVCCALQFDIGSRR
jgi:hypothetical protein